MKRWLVIVVGIGSLVGLVLSMVSASEERGEALFKEHCAACHPDGGNIVNPKKTLKHKDLIANKVASEDAIIKVVRNPGPGMLTFDEKTLSDKDARSIAKYILHEFKK